MTSRDLGGLPRAPRLTSQQLATLRCPCDVLGLGMLVLVLVGLFLFAPPVGILGIAGVVAIGLSSAIRQAALVGIGVPIETALGSDWARQVEHLLEATGRSPGSVRVVVLNDPTPNAFASWRPGRGGRVIALTSGLVRLVDGDAQALRFVLGHELAHLCLHFPLLLLVALPSLLPGALGRLGVLLRLAGLWWSRHAERSADRLGAVLAGSPVTALQVIVGLHQGTLPSRTTLVADLERLTRPSGDVWHVLSEALSDHPFLTSRLTALLSWAARADRASWWTPVQAEEWRWELAELGFFPDHLAREAAVRA
ncbi:MAG: M48 family metalloprotease [Chloroflexi bacterium]|nr:M48 family metalloprotease [Chloroflexota bacterium]